MPSPDQASAFGLSAVPSTRASKKPAAIDVVISDALCPDIGRSRLFKPMRVPSLRKALRRLARIMINSRVNDNVHEHGTSI
jgi:hypothetical protein